MRSVNWALLGLFSLACAGGDPSALGRVSVDTLSNGVRQIVSEGPAGWRDTTGWQLVEVARIGRGNDPTDELNDPQDVSLGADGAIYVADVSPAVIRKYSASGTFLHSIGHDGDGPGEFEAAYLSVLGGYVVVQDPRAARATVFDTGGRYLRSWHSVCCGRWPLAVDSSGNVGLSTDPPVDATTGGPQPYDRLVRWYRADSTYVDSTLIRAGTGTSGRTVRPAPGMLLVASIPWAPEQVTAFQPDRRMFVGFSDGYRIAVTGRQGTDTSALFGRAWTPTPISEATREAEVAREGQRTAAITQVMGGGVNGGGLQAADLPTEAAAFDWMGLDGAGDLWVRLPLPGDSTRSLFDVFDPDHRWLGQVSGSSLLAGSRMRLVGDRMVGFGEDEEGNPVVVVYRIERGGK